MITKQQDYIDRYQFYHVFKEECANNDKITEQNQQKMKLKSYHVNMKMRAPNDINRRIHATTEEHTRPA